MTIFILIFIGVFAGVLSGVFGIGGGIVIVPALIFCAKFQPQQATGTSLAALVLPVGAAIGAFTYYKGGHLRVRDALIISLGMAIGAWLGSQIGTNVDPLHLRRSFAVLLAVVAVKMWVS